MIPLWDVPFITPERDIPCPTLTRDFFAEDVRAARLDITGLGLYRAWINGRRVGNEYLSPGFNDYDAYLRFQSYDVIALLKAENHIEVTLGDGWYKGRFGPSGRRDIFGSRYLLSARLMITHHDGTHTALFTDERWLAQRSPITKNSIYDGEWRDDTIAPGVPIACRTVETAYRPEQQFSPPIRVKAERKPTLLRSPKGETILDFGQNMAGVVRFTSRLPRGGKMRLQFGELLQDGCFYRDNLRSAKAEYVYISDGQRKSVEPYFTFFGFRYVKIEGLDIIDPADFTALALSSDLKETLRVETDSALVNRLMENTLWGQRSNFLDVPTDCPQRDERLGWTADTQVFVNTACYQMDCKDFYRKFMRDMRADQLRYCGGSIPMYSPSLKGEGGPGGACWADAATIVPWNLYCHYGDTALLEESYPMMRDYVETLMREDEAHGGRHIVSYGFCFGDWLALDGPNELAFKGATEDGFVQSLYYCYSLTLTARAARVLALDTDAAHYETQAKAVRTAVLDEYFTPHGRLAVDTQTAYVLCLSFGLWRERDRLLLDFQKRLKADGYRLKTGFAGTPLLLPALLDNGMTDIAYRMLYREAFPGWLYAVKHGATTVWERWNSVHEDGSISDTGMNSLNHYAYGSVCEAIYSRIAGLSCAEPGWRRARIAPKPHWRMKHIRMSFDSPAGRYELFWQIGSDGDFMLAATIPDGCAAELVMPAYPGEGSCALEPGTHRFSYVPTVDYLHPFSGNTPAYDLMENPEAAAILKTELPMLYDHLTGAGGFMIGESPVDLCSILPFVTRGDVERADARLKTLFMV